MERAFSAGNSLGEIPGARAPVYGWGGPLALDRRSPKSKVQGPFLKLGL